MQIPVKPLICLNKQYNLLQVTLSLMDVEQKMYIANWQIKNDAGDVLKGAVYEPKGEVVADKEPMEVLNTVAETLMKELQLERA